jgi:hypothetical protein
MPVLAFFANIRLAFELSKENTIANYVSASVTKKKSFLAFKPEPNVIILLLPRFANVHNKLERLSLAGLSSLVL